MEIWIGGRYFFWDKFCLFDFGCFIIRFEDKDEIEFLEIYLFVINLFSVLNKGM